MMRYILQKIKTIIADKGVSKILMNENKEIKDKSYDQVSDVEINSSELNSKLDDPGNWPSIISNDIIAAIVTLGPIQIIDYDFPQNDEKPARRFTEKNYYRLMPNGEKVNRPWLIYSKRHNYVYSFCCKLFNHYVKNCNFISNGIQDWKNLSTSLKHHENSMFHYEALKKWNDLKYRLKTNQVIDKENLALIEKEKLHWRDVLKRILAAIHFLAQHNDSFRGSSDKLYTENNGKFLGLIEMMEKFDPTISEHVRRIKCKETFDHYLGPEIQN